MAAAQMVVGVMDEMAQVCDSKATAETLDTGPWMPSRLGLIFLHPLVQQAQQGQGLVSSLRIIKLGRKRKGSDSRILSKQQCSLLLPLLVPLGLLLALLVAIVARQPSSEDYVLSQAATASTRTIHHQRLAVAAAAPSQT